MNIKTYLRTGSAAAIAAVLAIGALPSAAHSQDQGRSHWRESRGGEQQSGQARQRPQVQERAAQPQQQQRTYQAPQQQQQQQQRTYQAPAAQERSGRDWNRSDRRSETGTARSGRDWNQSGGQWQAQAAARAEAQAQAQARSTEHTRSSSWGDRSGTYNRSGDNTWQRNRTYSDTARNQTYRSDQHRQPQQTQNAYRSGYRDGNRTGYRDGDRYSSWNRDWRRDNRYNWYSYRNQYRDRYRLGRYYAPYSNYNYSRLSIGFRLGSLFFGSRYWINDPWQYRLPEAYGPYRWVRYYDDALLVNTYSGEVVDVIYDFFW